LSQAYIRKQTQKRIPNENGKNNNNNNDEDEDEIEIISSDIILETIKNGISYLRDNALLSPPGKSSDMWLAAWERDKINDPQSVPTTAKLGGAGLALISLGQLAKIDSTQVSINNELRKLGTFIESLQNVNDGSFTCKYHWDTGKDDSWQSLYYPGEAALGLVILAELETLEVDNNENNNQQQQQQQQQQQYRWMKIASNTLLYLERYRRNQKLNQIEPDHWALLATSKLLPLLDIQRKNIQLGNNNIEKQKQLDIEYWLIYNHGIKVATSIVSHHTTTQLIKNSGCFSSDMRTCPTSTRLEGLLATLTFIKESEIYMGDEGIEDGTTELLRDRIEYDVAMGIRFLLNAQHKSNRNNMRGAMPGKYIPPKAVVDSNVNNDDTDTDDEEDDEEEENMTTEVRVDYVQHSMSAVIAYESYLLEKQQRIIDESSDGINNNSNDNNNFKNKVHDVADHITKRIRSRMILPNTMTTTMTNNNNDTLANFALLGIILFFVLIIIYIAYMPSLLGLSSSSLKRFFNKKRRGGRRRIKRQD